MSRLLIVDDSRFNRNRVKAALTEGSYDITEAENGAEALAYLETHPVDVVITDLLMPEVDGFGVLQRLREREQEVPVIVLSADIQSTSQQLCLELGAAAFLNKPFKPEELRAAVCQALSHAVQEC